MSQFVNSVSCAVKRFRRVVGLIAVNIFLLNGQFEQIKVSRIGKLVFEKHDALSQSFQRTSGFIRVYVEHIFNYTTQLLGADVTILHQY